MGTMALADYRTATLAALDDASQARFTNAQIDAALRWALDVYTKYRPLVKEYNLDTDGNAVMELPDDFDAIKIIKVELDATDIDDIREITYYAYIRDEAWWLETVKETIAADEVLNITYSARHTIDDLDSAAGTTIPTEDEHLVVTGAAGFALQQRASSRLETTNLNDDTIQRMVQLANTEITYFMAALTCHNSAGTVALPAVPTDKF